MWQTRIRSLSNAVRFHPPVQAQELATVESALNLKLPDDLCSLLLETDGVEGEYGLGLIWESQRIVTDNLSYRRNEDFHDLYMPFDPLLFFADAGNGDQFAYAIRRGEVRSLDIFVWDHENDSRSWVAPSLEKYLTWWLTGQLKV